MGDVRILGGSLRGRRLRVGSGVRPTEARVREALFSIWGPQLAEARVLDLFAGSGAFGIEAASRGAASALLVDRAPSVLGTLRRTVRALELPTVRVVRLDLPAGLGRWAEGGPFDLVFADPPYAFERHAELLERLVPLLAAGGSVAVEHGPRQVPPERAGGLERVDRRRYGDCELSFYAPDRDQPEPEP